MDKINIGVDVGGTTIHIGVVAEDGQIIEKITAKTVAGQGSEVIIDTIIDTINVLLQKMNYVTDAIRSIGIGFPGTVESSKGIVVFAPNIFFENVDVRTKIAQSFNCPVYLGQDSRAAAWAEYCAGSGAQFNNIAAITIGTGIGCGLVIDGKIFHGGYNTAGEFGHQLIDPDGYPCNCGRKGCLETFCGGLAILREGKKLDANLNVQTVKDVYDLAEQGHKGALAITDRVALNLGTGMVNLINLMSLEMITISGGISNAPDYLLLEPLRRFVEEHAYSAVAKKVKIVRSPLGDNAGLIGAALLDETTEF